MREQAAATLGTTANTSSGFCIVDMLHYLICVRGNFLHLSCKSNFSAFFFQQKREIIRYGELIRNEVYLLS